MTEREIFNHKCFTFEEALEFSSEFKTKNENDEKKLFIEILEEHRSIKDYDFTQIDNLIINLYKYPLRTLELENICFGSLLINIDISKYNKIIFKNCVSINRKITIASFDGSSADSVLNIEVSDSSLSILSYFPVKLNVTGGFTDLWGCTFKEDIKIFLSKKSKGFNFKNCTFLDSISANGEFYNSWGINFEECEVKSSNAIMVVENVKLRILKSSFKYIKFYSENKFPFLIDIDSSEIDLLLIEANQELTIKSQLKLTKINLLEIESGAKALELFNCIITKSNINGEITDKAIFNNVTFINPPEIGDIKFKNCNVEFRDIEFIDKNSPQAIAGFRALNKACRDANYHHGEIFFHGLTLEGIGKNLKYKSDFVEKLFSKAYKIFSNFGRSLNRPFYCLIILGLVVFGINWIGINKVNDLKLSQQLTINKFIIDNKQNLTNKDYFSYILSIIIKFYEEENQSNIINAKLVFKNAIGPLRIVLPRDFIEDNEEKLFKEKINFIIYFLNFFHAVISSGIWFIWFFMIRARFKL